MTLCPGKHDPLAMTGLRARELQSDLAAIANRGATALVMLMELHELERLGVSRLGMMAVTQGLEWCHLPTRDVSIPSAAFGEEGSVAVNGTATVHAARPGTVEMREQEEYVLQLKGTMNR